MLKRMPEFFIIDILIASNAVFRHIAKVENPIEFVSDELLFTAVTRECEIIGEATNNILKCAELKHLINPTWRKVVDFRNVISHEYFGLNYEDIFEIIKTDLPVFVEEIFDLAIKFKNSDDFKLALAGAQRDLQKIGRKQSVEYLEQLELMLYQK